VRDLAESAPPTQLSTVTVQDDVNAIGTDLDDMIANGHDDSNGGANLSHDVSQVQSDATDLGCVVPN
jgi:hypothetical protein